MTLPALKEVASALRETTEVLAAELACPSANAPHWSEFEWRVARAVASLHGISALLSRVLRWQGPDGWMQFLEDQRNHTASRHQRIEDLLGRIGTRAYAERIAIVPLKGAALYAIGIYELGTRPMADLDLLVREDEAKPAARILEPLGYRETHANSRHWVFAPPNCPPAATFGEHAANGIKIELHTRIRESLPVRAVDISELVFPQQLHPGLNDYPSRAALMTHLLLHTAGSMCGAVRLLQLHDIARLSSRMTEADWTEFLTRARTSDRMLWWAFPPLALTARYFRCIPDRVLLRSVVGCPWWLKRACEHRRLSDFPFSHLWIDAFPGIEMSQSIGEMLEYVASRVTSTAEIRARRNVIASSEPVLVDDAWSHMSQSRRILRWVTSRPARVQTLYAVRAALSQSP